MDEKDTQIINPVPIDDIQIKRRKENLRTKQYIPVWRHPDYRDNQLIISWEIPGFVDGIPIVGPELITKIKLPKGMNLYTYEHWNCTEEGREYLKARYSECMAKAEKRDQKRSNNHE